ncbi:MAG: dienelactone hydrolase family protein [Chloroflexi bacterium]|nr:dienelactone hydrolase family protein [Chloroflexota bacterium]
MGSASAASFPIGFTRDTFEHGGVTRDIYRAPNTGPAVILIHEAGGLDASTVRIADRIARAGLTPVLPVLVDKPRLSKPRGQVARNIIGLCTAREFLAFARYERTPIVDWLRGLAVREHELAGGPGVGVVGMCFSGGFAVAMVTEPTVVAVVSGEPALPWALPGRRESMPMSIAELDAVSARADAGFCVRILRYQRDFKSPGARMRFLTEMLPNASVVELPTWNVNRHSVLADATLAEPTSELGRALTGTINYLVDRLRPAS